MSLTVATMLFLTLSLVFCVACCASIAVATYCVVVLWREREAEQDSRPRSSVRNPAGRTNPRTIRVSLGGAERLAVIQRENPNPPAEDDARTNDPSRARLVPRSLANAVAQTSFILLNAVASRSGKRDPARSAPSAGPSGPSAPRVNICGPSAPRADGSGPSAPGVNIRGPSAPRADGGGLSAPGVNIRGSSAPRADGGGPSAPRANNPGPSASRANIPGPSNVGRSSRSAVPTADAGSTSASQPFGLLPEGTLIERHVRRNTPRAKAGDDGERRQAVTAYYQPAQPSEEPIQTPPNLSNDANLALGDLFYHRMRDGKFQLWLWCVGVDGQSWWKPVYEGYEREDGKWLLITPQLKVPGWVSWDRFSRFIDRKVVMDG